MARINEQAAAEAFVEKLKNGKYSVECYQNDNATYCKEEKNHNNIDIKEFTKSTLFKQFKDLK